MTRFKDFGSGKPVNEEPIQFALNGETFECRKAVPGKILLDLIAGGEEDATVVDRFFTAVLVEESLERFNILAVDPDRVVSVETLADIAGWLAEQYAARPSEQSNSSSDGQ
jgi:hypothetical protein